MTAVAAVVGGLLFVAAAACMAWWRDPQRPPVTADAINSAGPQWPDPEIVAASFALWEAELEDCQ